MDIVKKEIEVPVLPLEEVLECMQDKDEVIRMAGKEYYIKHYLNRLHNDRPSE